MAAGFLKHYAGSQYKIHSAGADPVERVHPLAIQVMEEDGIDISEEKPTHLNEYLGKLPIRFLIVVCDSANESCPRIFPGLSHRLYWPFDDPAQVKGTEAEILTEFRRVRDEIRTKILAWLQTEGTR